MAQLRPFRALRPVPERAAQVASVPYDVVNREEALEQASLEPLSLLRVTRSEITLAPDTDPYSDSVYEAARRNLESLIREAPLVREAEPSLYVFRLRAGKHEQVGVAGTYSIDEYEQDRILRHERTRQEKEDDRTRHILAVSAQTGPVFLAYQDSAAISAQVAREMAQPPLFDFTARDGVIHTVWRARDPGALVTGFVSVPALYIADGHHRAASACRARKERRATGGLGQGSPRKEDYDFFLAVAFPASQLRILPYHRVVKDLQGRSPEALLEALRKAGIGVSENASPSPSAGQAAMYLAGRWFGLTLNGPGAAPLSRIDRLDVSLLQSRVLEPFFGIRDPRTDRRIDFVGGVRGTAELERLVASGRAAVAFSMHPTRIEDLMAVSDAGQVMPPKSTWFEPKLRDGLLIHSI